MSKSICLTVSFRINRMPSEQLLKVPGQKHETAIMGTHGFKKYSQNSCLCKNQYLTNLRKMHILCCQFIVSYIRHFCVLFADI